MNADFMGSAIRSTSRLYRRAHDVTKSSTSVNVCGGVTKQVGIFRWREEEVEVEVVVWRT